MRDVTQALVTDAKAELDRSQALVLESQRTFPRSTAVHHMAAMIHAALPHLSFGTRALIDAMLLTRGPVGTAQWAATHLGLSNRFRLARRLAQEGLPPLHRLSGWMTVLSWLWEWEQNGTALCCSALRVGKDPAACRRLVRRITGISWKNLQTAEMAWALAQFLGECGAVPLTWSGTSEGVVVSTALAV